MHPCNDANSRHPENCNPHAQVIEVAADEEKLQILSTDRAKLSKVPSPIMEKVSSEDNCYSTVISSEKPRAKMKNSSEPVLPGMLASVPEQDGCSMAAQNDSRKTRSRRKRGLDSVNVSDHFCNRPKRARAAPQRYK